MTVAFWITLKKVTFSNCPKSNTFANHEVYTNVQAISRNKPWNLTCAWNSSQNGQVDDKTYNKDVVFHKLLWAEYKYVNSRSLSFHKVTFLCSICRWNGNMERGRRRQAKQIFVGECSVTAGPIGRAVYGRSPAEIVDSNPTGGMDVCLLWVLCVVR